MQQQGRRNIKLLPGTLPIKGRMLFGIEVIGIECSHMRQQWLGEAAAFDLVVRERSLQVLVQRPKRAVAVDSGKFGVVINDVTVADDGAHAAGLGALQDRVEQRRLGVEIGIADLPPIDQDHIGSAADLERADARWGNPDVAEAGANSCPDVTMIDVTQVAAYVPNHQFRGSAITAILRGPPCGLRTSCWWPPVWRG